MAPGIRWIRKVYKTGGIGNDYGPMRQRHTPTALWILSGFI